MKALSIPTLAASLLLLASAVAGAQTGRARIADTPIRGEANLASAIIATLMEGSPVDVVDLQGDWYRVLVPDEQGKPLVGYVLANLIEMPGTDGSPQSVAAPPNRAEPAVESAPIPPTIAQVALELEHERALSALAQERDKAAEREQALRAEIDALRAEGKGPPAGQPIRQVPSDKAPRRTAPYAQARDGFWFNAGLGFGSLGCDTCIDRLSGGSGGVSLGGTLNDRLLLGGGTTGYYRSIEDGRAVTVGTVDARLRFYPIRTSGFFVTGGIGLGTIGAGREGFISSTETGVGVVLGLGWDIRIRSNLSLTPFWTGVGVGTSNGNASVNQFGLGVTIH